VEFKWNDSDTHKLEDWRKKLEERDVEKLRV
jgi:hypothetical protein